MKRMSTMPNADPTQLAITEDAIRDELENGNEPPQGSHHLSSITQAGTPDLYSEWFSCANITQSTSLVAYLVCDRGTEPGQGAG